MATIAAPAAAAAAAPVLAEIPNYVHKQPVPMMPLGNTFLLVWALENLQVRIVCSHKPSARVQNRNGNLHCLRATINNCSLFCVTP